MPSKTSASPAPFLLADGLVDPRALIAIRNLELRARVIVQGFWSGLHRSPYHGFSVEFTEYRQYTPGDDTRYLDWRLYARSDRYYLKKFEDETNLRCHLLVDLSRSMQYGSLGYTKADYARTLAATLASFLDEQGDAVGLFTFDEHIREYLPARHRQGHLRRLAHALEAETSGRETNLDEPLRRAAELVRKRGLIVLISDFLAPVDLLEGSLHRLTAAGHELVLFQLVDPKEDAFDFERPMLFQDLESRHDLYLDPRMVRSDYRRRFEQHNAALDRICRALGVGCYRVRTDRALELALLDFLRSRQRRGRRIKAQTRPVVA